MKKPRPKKIRKVWVIKPKSRVHESDKKALLEKIRKRDERLDRS